jgi:hypothetical protein
MCYSTPMSFSFAVAGILTSYYIYFYNNFNYSYLPMLLLFYSTMEILQGNVAYVRSENESEAAFAREKMKTLGLNEYNDVDDAEEAQKSVKINDMVGLDSTSI